jgi:hypothetical protein
MRRVLAQVSWRVPRKNPFGDTAPCTHGAHARILLENLNPTCLPDRYPEKATPMPVLTIRRLPAVRYILSVLAVVALFLPGVALALSPTAPFANFPTEAQAQQHCPADTVVWLNLPTAIYHSKGQRWYGQTKSGAYVCRTEATQAGMRGSLNGQ